MLPFSQYQVIQFRLLILNQPVTLSTIIILSHIAIQASYHDLLHKGIPILIPENRWSNGWCCVMRVV